MRYTASEKLEIIRLIEQSSLPVRRALVQIGIDYGAKEEVKNIAAGKSATFDSNEVCGVTGPWGFSWMAKGDDTLTTDAKSMVSAEG